jgi:integrase
LGRERDAAESPCTARAPRTMSAPINPTVERYVDYERASRRRSPHTLRLKTLVLGQLTCFLAERLDAAASDPALLLCAELADLLGWQRSLRVRDASAAVYTSQVCSFYAWASRQVSGPLLDLNPAAELLRPARPLGLPRPIPDDDLLAALDLAAATDQRMLAWLLLGAECGMRCCEIAALHSRDITLDRTGQSCRVVVQGKGRKTRIRDGGPGLIAALRPYLQAAGGGGPLFTSLERATGRRRQIPAILVSNYLNRFLRAEVGVPDTAHSLRHWFGSTALSTTGNLRVVQDALGHATPAVTAVYTAVALDGPGGHLGQDMDRILTSRGQTDPRRRPDPAGHTREALLLHLLADSQTWPKIAQRLGLSLERAHHLTTQANALLTDPATGDQP